MSREVVLTKEIICAYLNQGATGIGISDISNIRHGDNDLSLRYIKALLNIFEVAKKELESELNNFISGGKNEEK